jgi:mannose/fructose/N-acetylgalactosamine-specific phosphotransferase system component IID
MDPILVRIYGPGEERTRARERHLDFFNTHPYFASAILGCAIRLEEDGGRGAEEAVGSVKNALMGPYGALGDGLYWGALKPFLVLLALQAGLRGHLWSPWAFLGLFAAANLTGRAYLFIQGYRRGIGIVDVVNRLNPLRFARRLKAACAVALGALLFSALPMEVEGGAIPAWLGAAGTVGFALVLSWALRSGVNPLWAIYSIFVISFGIAAWS